MPPSKKQDVNLPFPVNGVFESRPYDQQPDRTTSDAKNVLSFDVGEDKQRGGQRLGITRSTPDSESGGSLPDSRVQMLDVVPLGNETIGFPGGVITYGASSDSGVPDGTPCDFTALAIDPNQDGSIDDILGDTDPAPITGSETSFPIPLFELTSVSPKPTSANFADNAYTTGYGPQGSNHAILPIGEQGPVNTWNTSSPGLWHVKSRDGKQGCIFPKAPFHKHGVDIPGNAGKLMGSSGGNRCPSRVLATSPLDCPLGMFGGGADANHPTSTTYVSSVLLPTQSEDEAGFNSESTKNWAMTCNVCTPATDLIQYKSTSVSEGNAWSFYRKEEGHYVWIRADVSSIREYYYGFVFRVKATVAHEGSEIDSSGDGEQSLFVGFHQAPAGNTDGASMTGSLKPKLVIGSLDNSSADQMSLKNQRTLNVFTGADNCLEHDSWHAIDIRCVDNELEVRLDGVGPLPDINDASATRFSLVDFLEDDVVGNDFSTTRARSGLLFWRRANIGIGNISVTGTQTQGVENDWYWYNLNGQVYHIYGGVHGYWSGSDTGYESYSLRPNASNLSQPRDETWGPANDASTTSGGTGAKSYLYWRDDSNANRQVGLVRRDNLAFSYPTAFSETGYTEGDDLNSIGAFVPTVGSQMLCLSEFGGDYVRDWNEPYFHDFRWRNITDLAEVERVVLAGNSGDIYMSSNAGTSFAKTQPDNTNNDEENIVFDSNSSRIAGVEFYNQYYMCDGTKYLALDIPSRKLSDWSILCKQLASDDEPTEDSTLPGGFNSTGDTKASLIARHMGRLVLSGYRPFPNNWFMSDYYTDSLEVGHGPNNWDVTNGAVSGTSTGLAEIGEPIKAMFPFREESLVFGCLNSIVLLQGDPGDENSNASITSISRDIGIIGPDAWAHGPNRSLFFFGTNGLYYLSPNEFNVSQTNRLSVGRMDREFASIDLANFDVKLVYDYFLYGLHIFMSPKQPSTGATRHYFYDERSQAMWPMEYPNTVGPAATVYYPDPTPSLRRVLIGGYDGHVRYFDANATSDDGTAIDSYVWIGPFQVGPVTESKVMRIAAVLDAQSPNVNWGIYVGDTAEEAKSSTPVVSGDWKSGRNLWKHVRARGQNIYVKLSSNTSTVLPWSLENITATLAVAGRVRERN
jgi:hypothetical protein